MSNVGRTARILRQRDFASLAELESSLYESHHPVLLLAASAATLGEVMAIARPNDEVGHDDEPSVALALRHQRADQRAAAWHAQSRDGLTGLPNPAAFRDAAPALVAAYAEAGRPAALAMLDMDHFKRINDEFGHGMGDRVLQQVAHLMSEEAGDADLLCRMGGEEFLWLLARDEPDLITQALQRLCGRVRGYQPADGKGPALTLSAGFSRIEGGVDLAELTRRADMALYAAKADGRDRVVDFDSLAPAPDAGDHDLKVRHFQNVTRVVTERVASLISLMGQQVVRSIQHDADRDALTGLYNRRYLDRRLARDVECAARQQRPLALLVLDIDNFGRFNRDHGMPTGDAVLQRFAQQVQAQLRAIDWMARYGGEEFCVVLPATLAEALPVAERLRQHVADLPMSAADGQPIGGITVSIGVAAWRAADGTPADLVQRASSAVQAAKRAGRNRVVAAPD